MRGLNYKACSRNGKKNTSWIKCSGRGDWLRGIKKKKGRKLEMSSAFTVDEFVLVASITDIEMSPEAH